MAANPFIKFVGIQAPQLGKGYARFLLPFKPELANTIGLMQGGVIAALADEAVAYALYSLVADGETFNTVEMKINFLGAVKKATSPPRPTSPNGAAPSPWGNSRCTRPAGWWPRGCAPIFTWPTGRKK